MVQCTPQSSWRYLWPINCKLNQILNTHLRMFLNLPSNFEHSGQCFSLLIGQKGEKTSNRKGIGEEMHVGNHISCQTAPLSFLPSPPLVFPCFFLFLFGTQIYNPSQPQYTICCLPLWDLPIKYNYRNWTGLQVQTKFS